MTMGKHAKRESDNMGLYDWIQCVVLALTAGIVFFIFVARIITVDGSSMNPTLLNTDRVLVSDLFYEPKRGDIVVLQKDSFGERPIIKRVIAVEGQTIDIDFSAGKVYVDGEEIREPYIAEPAVVPIDFEGPMTVPENCVFVMGDNRNRSTDSRDHRISMVDERCIIGKAYILMLPGRTPTAPRDFHRVGSLGYDWFTLEGR